MADLSGVKVGDLLVIDDRFSPAPLIVTVDRVTATQAVAGAYRFAKEYGKMIGTSSRYQWAKFARPATEKDVMAARVYATQQKLSKFVVTADNVETVETLLKDNAK